MIFTNEIFKKGKSSRGGYSNEQLFALGLTKEDIKIKGWKYKLFGKNIPDQMVNNFLSLKDAHLKGKSKNLNKNSRKLSIIRNTNVNKIIPYKEQYMHPLWQKTRLIIMERDNFKCRGCGDKESTLNVHHIRYNRSSFVWDVPDYYLVTLCEPCHRKEHNIK